MAHKILIVDDNIYYSHLLADQLTRLGYAVRVMSENEELLKLLSADDYDLLIMELLLNGQDGLSLLRWIRCSPYSYLPILVVSHRSSGVEQLRVAEFDAHFLSKPVDLNQLIKTVIMILKEESRAGISL
ncbi:MAG TPA: hypothetical protein DEF42_00085 [Desulfosporosinus sp.]|nr:hypothetical protein [Desulfosporosinus sp.]